VVDLRPQEQGLPAQEHQAPPAALAPTEGEALSFRVLQRDGAARRGSLRLRHGEVETPIFMPVGTYGAVKGMSPESLKQVGAQIILGNTFHLWLRPGTEVIGHFGGLHRFIQWDAPILTDSGGFQVWSLGALRKVEEEGVHFASPINGDKLFLSPEGSIAIQTALDSDVVMIFDECTPYSLGDRLIRHDEACASMERSLRWAQRSKDAFLACGNRNALFGIVQGGMHEDLRVQSCQALTDLGFHGYAIGGLSVGEPKEEMQRVLAFTAPRLPEDRPRYLMGVGTPEDLVEGVGHGIDMFDCVMPTRNARNAWLFTSRGDLRLRNARYRRDERPIDPACACPCCSRFSRAYLHHLHRVDEMLGAQLATVHNLYFYLELMRNMRDAIMRASFQAWSRGFLEQRRAGLDA